MVMSTALRIAIAVTLLTGLWASRIAELGDVPYIVSIWQTKDSGVLDFRCAGALLTADSVLTSVSCVEKLYPNYNHLVSAGHVFRGNVTELQFYDVAQVTRHELYDNVTKLHDIAIIEVASSIVLGPYTRPIKLAQVPVEPGTQCTISGWRLNFFFTTDDLRLNDASILYSAACSVDATDGQLCAGSLPAAEECNVGDEGGALVCEDAVRGLYAPDSTVCLDTSPEPGQYLDLAPYVQWIVLHVPGVEVSAASSVNVQGIALALAVTLCLVYTRDI